MWGLMVTGLGLERIGMLRFYQRNSPMTQNSKDGVAAREAKYGEKMVQISVRFWTDQIVEDKQIRPKHAWSSGVVGIARNKSHSIVPGRWKPFNSLMELGSVIEQLFIEHNIVLHHSTKMKKYMAEQPDKLSPKVKAKKTK
jgi:hypothetical protein